MSDIVSTSSTSTQPIYFDKVTIDNTNNPRRLDIVRADRAPEPPEGMLLLWTEIVATGRIIASLFAHDVERRREFFEGLYIAAETGLVGPDYSVVVGWSNLKTLKTRVADAFPDVRDKFWRSYLLSLVLTSLVCLPIGIAVLYGAIQGLWTLPKPTAAGVHDLIVVGILAILWIPVGAALGIFLEFIFSVDREVPFENLFSINPGRWRPFQQFVNTMFTAWAFAFFMGINFFQIGLMAVLLNDFATTKPYLSLAVGFVTGFAFPYVRDIIYKIKPVTRGTP